MSHSFLALRGRESAISNRTRRAGLALGDLGENRLQPIQPLRMLPCQSQPKFGTQAAPPHRRGPSHDINHNPHPWPLQSAPERMRRGSIAEWESPHGRSQRNGRGAPAGRGIAGACAVLPFHGDVDGLFRGVEDVNLSLAASGHGKLLQTGVDKHNLGWAVPKTLRADNEHIHPRAIRSGLQTAGKREIGSCMSQACNWLRRRRPEDFHPLFSENPMSCTLNAIFAPRPPGGQ